MIYVNITATLIYPPDPKIMLERSVKVDQITYYCDDYCDIDNLLKNYIYHSVYMFKYRDVITITYVYYNIEKYPYFIMMKPEHKNDIFDRYAVVDRNTGEKINLKNIIKDGCYDIHGDGIFIFYY